MARPQSIRDAGWQGRNRRCGPDGAFSMTLDKLLKLRRIRSGGMGNYDGKLNDGRSGNNDEVHPTQEDMSSRNFQSHILY